MQLDGAAGDRESEADPAAVPAAVGLDPKERLEDRRRGCRGARQGAVVADVDLGPVDAPGQLDLDGAARRGVPDGIPQDVLAGAAEELAVPRDDDRPLADQLEPAAGRVGLEGTIGDELME